MKKTKITITCPFCRFRHLIGTELINPESRKPKFVKELVCQDDNDVMIRIECKNCKRNFLFLLSQLKGL